MRRYVATGLSVALIAVSLPNQLSAQRGGEGRGGAEFGSMSFHATIPHAPTARSAGNGGPLFEPGRPRTSVPYVRNGQWYGHAAVDDSRFRVAQPFAAGRFALTGPSHVYNISRVDFGTRRVWLPGGPFAIAAADWEVTAPWCWTCDQFVVYPDPDHPGWYLIYDVRMGEYVHAQFLGA